MSVLGPAEFGAAAMNDAKDTLVQIQEKRLTAAEVIAGAAVSAQLAQASAMFVMAEQIGHLAQEVRMHPGISSDGLTNALNKVFGQQDNEPFVSYRECYTQDVAHLPHRWTVDNRNHHYCEGKTPAQLRAEQES